MHGAVLDFARWVKALHPDLVHGPILELGSFNMNGSVRDVLKFDDYTGLDVRPGPGVDIVGTAPDAPAREDGWQVVVSTEMAKQLNLKAQFGEPGSGVRRSSQGLRRPDVEQVDDRGLG